MIRKPLRINIDHNVLNHLGIGLYSNTPAVLTEIVANAWDADAEKVRINIYPEKDKIVIYDDGCGMSYEELQTKFLTVGYARREKGGAKTGKGRQCMGRKGIGKLAMFSLASDLRLVSKKKSGELNGFSVNVPELKEKISTSADYEPTLIEEFLEHEEIEHGTVITLTNLNKQVNKTEGYLRKRIARRFSVLGPGYGFEVLINDSPVTLSDRGFYSSLQFIWTFGDYPKDLLELSDNKVRHHHFDGELSSGNKVNGFIASVVTPEQLRRDKDNNNTITLLANGRIFEEDIQKRIDDSRVFNSYLVGELQANHLDDNDLPDIAVSSRQGVQENDLRFKEFIGYIKTRLNEIARMWDEWRREIGAKEISEDYPAIQEWLSHLDKAVKPLATRLIGKTNTFRFTGSPEEQLVQKHEVLKAQVVAFEKLQVQKNIASIDSIDIEKNVADFRDVIVSIEDIEASMYHDIVRQRLAVIKKLDEHQQDEVKEQVVQKHIYEHLWLVDSSWEYKQEPTDFELRLSKYLKAECPDNEEGARLDIGYRTTAGRYIVLELKRPGLRVTLDNLIDQGEKYAMSLRRYFHENPGSSPVKGSIPSIDIVFVIDKRPAIPEFNIDYYNKKLDNLNAKITTYKDLIKQSTDAYEDFLKASKKVDRVRNIMINLDKPVTSALVLDAESQ
ncbi:ATP-binding protein [Ectopseudomonas khazarica]|uniref:ATP-binding protein n=1 Tax=Ectopseudomonas khazarica TaxID=2502979 RepID=A0ABW7M8A0_9GAMM